jgi:glyoxylase-like metal-dependent hydrolase (beta-lactamase superfamily II)
MPLEESGQLDLVDGREEIASRVWVEPAPGPAAGHQILITERARDTVAFLGALVPTLMHLTPGVVSAADRDPDETVASKHSVLRRAVAHRWSLAATGSDRVLAAEEVLDLALWREATAPVQRERVPQHAVVAMAV